MAKTTIISLLLDLGEAWPDLHNRKVRNLKSSRLQCDEIWSFVGAQKMDASPEKKAEDGGDVWTWTALDA